MTAGTVAVGALLLSPIAFGAVEAVGYIRGRFLRSFWELPLDAKLDHIGRYDGAWWVMTAAWPPLVIVLTGGLGGFAFVLGDVVAWAAFGVFVVAAVAWLMGIVQQGAALSVAAQQRNAVGETPGWAFAVSRIVQMLETVWVVAANVAAAGYGVAVLRTDLLPQWLGWVAVVGGLAIPAVVIVTREVFPHLALPVVMALGVGLLVTAGS